jgi:Tol biopolymer transport system component
VRTRATSKYIDRMRKGLLVCLSLGWLVACRRSTEPAQPPLSPAVFTPDGSAVVISVARAETCFLYRVEIATGATRRLTEATDGCEFDPAFSSDGRQLAFMRAPRSGASAALVLANADGRNPRMLVSGDSDNLRPVFVPHANQIVFLRSGAFEHHSPVVDNARHKFDIFSADVTSGRVTALTHEQFYLINTISVSPDGQQLLVSLYTYPDGDRFAILPIATPQAPARTVRPQPFAVVYHALWLPDGGGILFSGATEPPGGGDFDYNVYRLTVASGAIEQLTHLSGVLDGLSVSPDGAKAALLYRGAYYLLDIATHRLTPIPMRIPA